MATFMQLFQPSCLTWGTRLTWMLQKFSWPTRNWNCRKASTNGMPSMSPIVPPSCRPWETQNHTHNFSLTHPSTLSFSPQWHKCLALSHLLSQVSLLPSPPSPEWHPSHGVPLHQRTIRTWCNYSQACSRTKSMEHNCHILSCPCLHC